MDRVAMIGNVEIEKILAEHGGTPKIPDGRTSSMSESTTGASTPTPDAKLNTLKESQSVRH